MGEKIVELQGLRCIAIISVLLFHIWPDIFGNGFLGVDIFFVVSGYIMAMILLSSESLKESFFTTTLTFYYRRIYRILPLYLLNILVTVIIVPTMSYTVSYFNLLSQVKSALTFSTNFAMLFQKDNYFNKDLFTAFKHYWSLCVEMQFYAIVPFILYFSKRLPFLVSLFLLWPLLIAASIFMVFYSLFYINHSFYFTMLPARIYEFIAGFVAFHFQQAIDLYFHDDQKVLSVIKKVINSVITVNILTLSLIILALYPMRGHEEVQIYIYYTLPATVILTAALITSIGRPKKKNETKYSILANKFCIFIGDASYSLYICHWIIVFLGKLLYGDDQQYRQTLIIVCSIVGILVHLCIEKPIVKARLKPEAFFPWIIFAYLLIGYFSYSIKVDQSISNLTKEIFHNKSELIGNSKEWKKTISELNPEDSAKIGVYSWQESCNNRATEWTGNGNFKVLILGNSHALCSVSGVKLAMKGIYSKLRIFAIAGGTPFEGFQSSFQIPEMKQVVTNFKPDIIYLIFKYVNDFDDPPTSAVDFQLQKMQEMTDFLSKNSKVLFISKMHFEIPHFSSLHFAEKIYRNGWINDFRIKQKDIEDRHDVSTHRWKQIKCDNCIFIDMLKAFCKNGWCSPIESNRKVPLYFDDNHVNKLGSHLLGFHLQTYFDPMFKLLNSYASNIS